MQKLTHHFSLPLLLCLCTFITIYSCANTNANKKIDAEIKAETPIKTSSELTNESLAVINDSASLSDEQKYRLAELTTRVNSEMNKAREEEAKVKIVLFKTIVRPDATNKEITILKNRVIEIDRKKTDRMLSALEEAQKIMGRRDEQDEKFYRAILMDKPNLEIAE